MEFGYENLEVWKKAVEFAVSVISLVEAVPTKRKHYRIIEQIEASATSIAMNIAEGKGRYSKKEFKQYLYISRGSLYETLTLLEILSQMGWFPESQMKHFKDQGMEIVKMLKGLINSI